MRTFKHYTSRPVRVDWDKTYAQEVAMKPSGLWLSVGTAWSDWCEDAGFGGDDDWGHVLELEVDDTEMLLLDTEERLLAFDEEYRRDVCGHVAPPIGIFYPDWALVAEEYAGVIFDPYYFYRLRLNLLWYYSVDCASACVWDLSKVRVRETYRQVRGG